MTSEELAKEFTKYINLMSRDDSVFVDIITGQHRTLQQQAFSLFIECIKQWSETSHYDLRNAHTIEMCKKIMEIDNINAIPFI